MRVNYHQVYDESASRLSRSKSKKQLAAKLRDKQSGWNDRFHLEHIPPYNYNNEPVSQQDKDSQQEVYGWIYRHADGRNDMSKNKKIPEQSLEKNKVSNKPNPRKNQIMQRQAISKAFSDLKVLWNDKNIPDCHREIMTRIFNRQNNTMKILEDIKIEFLQISKDSSLIQKIMVAVDNREKSLQKIRDSFTGNSNQALRIFEDNVGSLRNQTIHCVQYISHWKQSLQQTLPKTTKICYNIGGNSYMSTIIEDYFLISKSILQEVCAFQEKADPFFINYKINGKKDSSISKNFIKRVRLCDLMLREQQRRIQNIVQKRTTILNRPKINQKQQKSLPSHHSTPLIPAWKKVSIDYGQFQDYFKKMILKSYFNKSFQHTVNIHKYQEISIFQFSQTTEEIVLAVDKFASQRKIIILGLQVRDQNIQILLKSLCQHIWQHDTCSQLRISLIHHMIGDQLIIDPDLGKRLKATGFRWISVNNSGQVRTTIFGMKRPLNTVPFKNSSCKQSYPVIIQHLCALSLVESAQRRQNNRCFMSVLQLIQSIKSMDLQQYKQLCNRDEFNHHFQCIERILSYNKNELGNEYKQMDNIFNYSGLKSFLMQRQQTKQKIFNELLISSKIINIFPSYISLLNVSYKLKNTIINDNKYIKFFPNKDNQIIICQSNYPIYLLQTDQENMSIFIIEVQDNFSMSSIDNIFNAMGQESSFIDQFWLPIFSISYDYIDQVGFKNTQLVSTSYWTSLGSLTRKSKVKTKVIKAPFVFGMINKKVLQMLQIPFYCTLVRKQDLI